MYAVGDTVLYGTDGVCTVTEITEKEFGKTKEEYIVLTSFHQNGTRIYVPTASATLSGKIRRVMSAEELTAMLREVAQEQASAWIDDDRLRREHFKAVLSAGDRRELIRMIRAIYRHGKFQKENGRKLHRADESMMKDAQRLLHDEFAYVFGIRPDDVPHLIEKELDI